MRRLALVVVCAALTAAVPGCRRHKKARIETIEESGPQLSPVINMADPHASVQLLKGFYDIEQNAWRWTKGSFSVTLRPPLSAVQKGATLEVKFAAPDPVIAKVKSFTLAANVNGTAIPGETFSKAGEYKYSKDVPASAFGPDAVTVEFAMDKFLPPGSVDQRELGIVVSSIGLEPK
jgi:hypothetical protein